MEVEMAGPLIVKKDQVPVARLREEETGRVLDSRRLPLMVREGASGVDEDDFKTVWSKRGRGGGVRERGLGRGLGRSLSFDRGRGGESSVQGEVGGSSKDYFAETHGILVSQQQKESREEAEDFSQTSFTNPMYFKMLPNGDFEDEIYEDEKDWEPDEDHDEMKRLEFGNLLEKREAGADDPRSQINDSMNKKGRFETSEEIQLS